MIREFVQSIDDREWQTQLFALLQKQTYNQVEVDLFELMCKVLDQNLFSQVDWARNTVFFKDLKVCPPPSAPLPVPISSPQHSPQTTTSFQARGQVCDVLCKTNQKKHKTTTNERNAASRGRDYDSDGNGSGDCDCDDGYLNLH